MHKTWAGPFRDKVLPLIDEEPFRPFYHPDNGRPNVPVGALIGVSVLKEMHNLTDNELLGSLEFGLGWRYGLDIHGLEAHTCHKTLHNFRTLVSTNEIALCPAPGRRTRRKGKRKSRRFFPRMPAPSASSKASAL